MTPMTRAGANLVLIGLRGSGKTTIGRRVAGELGRPFIDLDDLTAAALQAATPGEAFTRHGEPAFRRAEAEVLARVLRTAGQVVALGGGTPTAPGAGALLRGEQAGGRAFIVYLSGSPAVLRGRLSGSDMSRRPSLTGADPLAEIEAVFARRDPLFRELADEVIEPGGSVESTARDVIERTAPGGDGARG